MVIDTRKIPEGRSSIEQESPLEAFVGDLPPMDGPVRCTAEVDRMGGRIVANLRFAGEFRLQCARCLDDFDERVEGGVTVIIKEEQGRHGQAADDGAGADFYFDPVNYFVDISPAIYDEIMTALPLKPLCFEDCAGIAADGDDESKSDMADGAVDPRWEALKKLF